MQYNHKREKTRTRIRDAFITLYKEKDISRITVRQICEMSDINRSTFYTYYEDVYALLADVENTFIELFGEMAMPIITDTSRRFAVEEIFALILEASQKSGNIPMLLVRRGNTEFIDRIVSFATDYMQKAGRALTEEQVRLIRLLLHYHIPGVAAAINAGQPSGAHVPSQEMVSLLGDVASNGVLTVFRRELG